MPENIKNSYLKLDGIKKTYNPGSVNEVVIFRDFSLAVEKGSFVSVVGSNGSGKTTLLGLVCGSVPMDGGSITLDGEDITKLREFERARYIGRVFQSPDMGTCPALTILENMSLADNKGGSFGLSRAVDKNRIDFYKTRLELLRLGLENRTEQPVGTLSGGQRQALALLMCTLTPIKLLVLDEHTAALDPASSDNVMALTEGTVKELGITTLMVTHNLRHAAEHGDRLVMLHEGHAVMDIAGEEKAHSTVNDLLGMFNAISVECGN